MLICWNAEGVHGKRKVANPSSRMSGWLTIVVQHSMHLRESFHVDVTFLWSSPFTLGLLIGSLFCCEQLFL